MQYDQACITSYNTNLYSIHIETTLDRVTDMHSPITVQVYTGVTPQRQNHPNGTTFAAQNKILNE